MVLKVRVSKKASGTGKLHGAIHYLPKEYIGKEVYLLNEDEYQAYKNFRALEEILSSFIKYMSEKRKMFCIISETWNPITGCKHVCKYCWAMKRAEMLRKSSKRYERGFTVMHFNESELSRKFKGGIVFVSDMGDMWGEWVPSEYIRRVLNQVREFKNTYFLFMTKNPRRYHEFLDIMPENAILGTTIETNDDVLYVKNDISGAPLPSARYECMRDLDWDKKMVSIEPILDFNLEVFVKWIKDISPIMVFVGYDNYNNKLPEPPLEKTRQLIKELRIFTFVVEKTIRPAWNEGLGI